MFIKGYRGFSSVSEEVIDISDPRTLYRDLWLHAECDSANVDLLATLLQDAPQLILQLYIMIRSTSPGTFAHPLSKTSKY